MKIPELTKTQIVRLIDERSSLHPFDVEAFHRWMQVTYETLQFDRVQQQRFDEYCRSSCGVSSSMRLRSGVSILKQALYKDTPEN